MTIPGLQASTPTGLPAPKVVESKGKAKGKGKPAWMGDAPMSDRVRAGRCPRCSRFVGHSLVGGVLEMRYDLVALSGRPLLAYLTGGPGRGVLRLWPKVVLAGRRRVDFAGAWEIKRGDFVVPVHDCDVRHDGAPDFGLLGIRPRRTPTDTEMECPF